METSRDLGWYPRFAEVSFQANVVALCKFKYGLNIFLSLGVCTLSQWQSPGPVRWRTGLYPQLYFFLTMEQPLQTSPSLLPLVKFIHSLWLNCKLFALSVLIKQNSILVDYNLEPLDIALMQMIMHWNTESKKVLLPPLYSTSPKLQIIICSPDKHFKTIRFLLTSTAVYY